MLLLLLHKTLRLKLAHPWWTLSEILLPLTFIFLLVSLQHLDPDRNMPASDYTCPRATAFSPTLLYPHASNSTDQNSFFFTVETIGFGPGLQTVPPLIYVLALAAKTQSRIAFVNGGGEKEEIWLKSFADDLDEWTSTFDSLAWRTIDKSIHRLLNVPFCRFRKLVVFYQSEKQLDQYVQSNTYGEEDWNSDEQGCPTSKGLKPKLLAAVVMNQAGGPDWKYAIRTNVSIIPPTYPQVGFIDPLQVGVDEEFHDDYMMSGFLTLQLAVERRIINRPVRTTLHVKQLAINSLCDSIDPIIEEIESLGNLPQLKKLKCKRLMTALELSGISLDPLFKPASFEPVQIRLAPFPTPAYVDRPFFLKIEDVLSLVLLLCYLWPTSRLLRGIVHEKETRLRESMKMMGIGQGPIMISWLVTYGFMFGIVALLITGVSRFHLFSKSDASLVFLFFFLFGLDIVAFAFMVSVLFDRAKTASTAGVSLFFAAYFAFFAVNTPNASANSKSAVSILAPTAFGIGSTVLAHYEEGGEGVCWSNIWDAPSPSDLSFAAVLEHFIADLIIYLVLGFYLDQVVPSEFGLKKPWNFLCTLKFWQGEAVIVVNQRETQVEEDGLVEEGMQAQVIKEPIGLELQQLVKEDRCVVTNQLTKKFSTPTGIKVALQGLDLTCYEGEIFCLLGQNGAGKSTTINLLTGMMSQSSGSASILGWDVSSQMDHIRQTMGVCPQHDCLWDELTVYEHLEFVASVRKIPNPKQAITKQISQVGLIEKTDCASSSLSGGQKRKLSLAMALLGDSRIVFLDEPTSGMDPYSRRFTWNLLQNSRAGRVIILTTHFMDEADALGDRIGIMAHGKLMCVGSSHFLKAHYGVGYTLTLVGQRGGDRSTTPEGTSTPAFNSVEAVERLIPEAKLLSAMGQEVTYQVPFSSARSFPLLFDELDDKKQEMGIQGYGVSVTTLDSVFVKVGLEAGEDSTVGRHRMRLNTNGSGGSSLLSSPPPPLPLKVDDKKRLFSTQFSALFNKRFVYSRRDNRSVCCNIILPILLLILGLGMLKAFPLPEPPPLLLKRDQMSKQRDQVPWACSKNGIACSNVANKVPGNVFVGTNIVPLNNSCDLDDCKEIPYGNDLKGFSRWLSNQSIIDTTIFGAFHFDSGEEITVFSNTTSMHAAPIYINQVNEALLQQEKPEHTISLTNAPFHFTARLRELVSTFAALSASISIIVAFSFIPASIAVFVVKERETSAKHQQILAGTSLVAYWISNFCFDAMTFIVPWFAGLVCVKVFGIDAFVEDEAFVAVAVLFASYGLAVTPFTYLLSFLFVSHSTAQNVVLLVNFITGLVLMIASLVMSLIPNTIDLNEQLEYVYRLFPGFCLGNGLLSLTINSSKKTFGDGVLIKAESSFAWDVIGANVLYLLIESVLYLCFVILLDMSVSDPWLASQWCSMKKKNSTMQNSNEASLLIDEDVFSEMRRIDESSSVFEDVIRVEHLHKSYGQKVAVQDLTFGIARGECFGFLGINGAGKTTTLKMLTGDLLPTSGTAKIAGLDILQEQAKVRRLIGYCPQFDALLDLLSVREHLELYGRLKGVMESVLNATVVRMMRKLRLVEFEHRLAGTLSGGNKRKLSVAVAMIGEPQILILDEPTTGLDVVNRRFLCDVVADYAKTHGVILTTHSMEEVEALCTQVGIIVSGQLKCFGSIQHLKGRFGQGILLRVRLTPPQANAVNQFLSNRLLDVVLKDDMDLLRACELAGKRERFSRITLEDATGWVLRSTLDRDGEIDAIMFATWWIGEDDAEKLDSYVKSCLPGAHMLERRGNHVSYRVMELIDVKLGQVFGLVENKKDELRIAEYSISETTLEQIFVSFALQGEEAQVVRGMM